MIKSVNCLESFQNQIVECKEQLIVAADLATDNCQRQEILAGIAKLTEYETVICQRLHLLMNIDPNISQLLIDKSFDYICGSVQGLVEGSVNEIEDDKFINFRSIENYPK